MLDNFAFLLDVLVFSILSIAWFYLSAFQFYFSEVVEPVPLLREENHTENKYNSIDRQLLKAKQYDTYDDIPFGSEIIIDGTVFKENIKLGVGSYREFELYSLNLKMDDCADTSGVSTDEDTCLQMYIQPVPYGVIINSNVFLSNEQWNTVYHVSEDTRRCGVCDVYCDVTRHIASAAHRANMDRHKPLEKYDLTVTRKINNNYHCGVCNLLFDQSLKDGHFTSKHHEDKMLFAINKVSDIMYDYNIHNNNNDTKKDSYHFDANLINQLDNILDNEELDDLSSEESEEYYNDNWNPFNTLRYNDGGDYYDDNMPNLAHSYASMARKPKSDELPAVLEIDLGNKKVTVKFDSWNMVISPKLNRFYCMACKTLDHVRRKAEHCRSEEHLARLDECTVVEEYEKYLVRLVNDKLYHCGHCNNLQLIHEMEDHIESQHPASRQTQLFDSPAKKISTPTKSPVKTNPNDAKHEKTDVVTNYHNNTYIRHNENAIAKPIYNAADMYNAIKEANSNFDDIVICTYGKQLRISKIAFNIVCQGEHNFYCGLCEVNISDEGTLKKHINGAEHLARLQRTPFIEAFNVNLFREIRDALHCALCNELIQIMPEFIIKHKYLEKHIICLSRALGNTKDDKNIAGAKNDVKTTINNVTVDKTKPVDKTRSTETKTPSAVLINGLTAKPIPNVGKKDTVTNKNVALDNIPTNTPKAAKTETNKASNATNNNASNNEANANVNKATINSSNVAAAKVNNKENKPPANIKNSGPITPPAATKETSEDFKARIEAEIAAAKHEEFVVVKNGVKDVNEDLDESFSDDYDYEEYIYVKLGNTYIKITNASYHTLVDVGDGSKYCFVCSSVVGEIQKHIESRGHTENMEKFKFVDKYNEDLLRQFYLMYHCSICNVVITRKQLHHHLSWPTHTLQTENTKISSKKRKNEIKAGTKHVTVSTQKENIYLNEKETDIKIYLNIAIEKELLQIDRKNKIVIFNDNVLKIDFECWHSLTETDSGYKCKVCQCDFEDNELGGHVSSEWHKGNLEKFDKQYSPALIRKINDFTLNCVVCNTEVSNQKRIVTEHILGKKHVKNYDTILRDSSVANSYADCDEDVLML